MSNLNKIYHKGKYRSGEWAKHLRPYLKRVGNKRFRKQAVSFEEEEFIKFSRYRKKRARKRISAKITVKSYGDREYSYYSNYCTLRDLENVVKRPNVVRYLIIDDRRKLND